MNKNRFILKHLIGNILKIEGNGIYKIPEKEVTYKQSEIRKAFNFSITSLETKRKWGKVFKILKGNALYSRVLYPA